MSQPARWPGPQMKWIPMCSWHRTLVIHFSGWNGKKMSLIRVRCRGTNETLLLRIWVHVCLGGFCLLSRGWIQGDRWLAHNFSPGSFKLRWSTVILKKSCPERDGTRDLLVLSDSLRPGYSPLILLLLLYQFMRPNTRVGRIFGSFAIKSLDFDGGPAADIVTATGRCKVFDDSCSRIWLKRERSSPNNLI